MNALQPPMLVPSTDSQLVIRAEYPNITPELLFDYFVRPNLITRWWSPVAHTHARQGGQFHFAWQEMDLHLRGQYTMVERGAGLGFTWQWDHEKAKGRPPRTVTIRFQPCRGGTGITITHAPYANTPAEQSERHDHAEAWCFFLARLQQLAAPANAA